MIHNLYALSMQKMLRKIFKKCLRILRLLFLLIATQNFDRHKKDLDLPLEVHIGQNLLDRELPAPKIYKIYNVFVNRFKKKCIDPFKCFLL